MSTYFRTGHTAVKNQLGFTCLYGTQDITEANACANKCINYIKSQSILDEICQLQ